MNIDELNIWVISHKDGDDLFEYSDYHKHLHVGAAINNETKYEYKDDIGDNISNMNPVFSELTGMYWVWKNYNKSKFVGFEHYRRHFNISNEYILDQLNKYDILVPQRNNVLTSVKQHYNQCHNINDLELAKEIIYEFYPEYQQSYELIIENGKNLFSCNSFITTADNFDKMFTFLFKILQEFQKRLHLYAVNDFKQYVVSEFVNMGLKQRELSAHGNSWIDYQTRLMGFLSERLITLWIFHNIPIGKIKQIEFKFKD